MTLPRKEEKGDISYMPPLTLYQLRNAIASGYVGEIVTAVTSSLTNQTQGTWKTGTGISLTAGIWKIRVRCAGGNTAPTEIQAGITTTVNGTPLADSSGFPTLFTTVDAGNTVKVVQVKTDGIFNHSTTTMYYPTMNIVSPNATNYSMDFIITAIRIA